jgi:hypothetical protein
MLTVTVQLTLIVLLKVVKLIVVGVCLKETLEIGVSITQDVYQIIAISGVVKVYRKGKMQNQTFHALIQKIAVLNNTVATRSV